MARAGLVVVDGQRAALDLFWLDYSRRARETHLDDLGSPESRSRVYQHAAAIGTCAVSAEMARPLREQSLGARGRGGGGGGSTPMQLSLPR